MAQKEERRGIENKLHARANATLTIATVAASASLIILTFVMKEELTKNLTWIKDVGFLFSILGPLYRELTILTIDRKDYQRKKCLKEEKKRCKPEYSWWEIIPRMVIVRFLLFLPIAAWWIFRTSPACFWTTMAVTIMGSVLFSIVEWRSRDP